MGWRPEATQAAPRRSRPIGGGCCLADCHSLRRWVPTSRSATPLPTQTVTHSPQPECIQTSQSPRPPYIDVYGGEKLGMGSTAMGREASRV
jgi:hypothetical protein